MVFGFGENKRAKEIKDAFFRVQKAFQATNQAEGVPELLEAADEALSLVDSLEKWPLLTWRKADYIAIVKGVVGRAMLNASELPTLEQLYEIIGLLSEALSVLLSREEPHTVNLLESYTLALEMKATHEQVKPGQDALTTANMAVVMAQKIRAPELSITSAISQASIVSKQGWPESHEAIDILLKALKVAEQIGKPDLLLQVYTQLGEKLLNLYPYMPPKMRFDASESAVKFLLSGLQYSQFFQTSYQYACYHMVIARSFMNRKQGLYAENRKHAVEAIDTAMNIFEDIGDYYDLSRAKIIKASLIQNLPYGSESNNYNDARNLLKSIFLDNEIELYDDVHFDAQALLAFNHELLPLKERAENQKKSLDYFRSIISGKRSNLNCRYLHRSYSLAGTLLTSMYLDDPDLGFGEAEKYFDSAAKYFIETKDFDEYCTIIMAKFSLLEAQDRNGIKDKAEEALNFITEAISSIGDYEDFEFRLRLTLRIGLFFLIRTSGDHPDNIELGIAHLEEALLFATEHIFPQHRAEIYRALARAYEARPRGARLDNLKEALRLFECAQLIASHNEGVVLSGLDYDASRVRTTCQEQDLNRVRDTWDDEKIESRREEFVSKYLTEQQDGRIADRVAAAIKLAGTYISWMPNDTNQTLESIYNRLLSQTQKSIDLLQNELRALPKEKYLVYRYQLFQKIASNYNLQVLISTGLDLGIDNLATIYRRDPPKLSNHTRKTISNALENYTAACELAIALDDSVGIAKLLRQLGQLFVQSRNWKQASICFQKAEAEQSPNILDAGKSRLDRQAALKDLHVDTNVATYSLLMAQGPFAAIRYLEAKKAQILSAGLLLRHLPNEQIELLEALTIERRGLEKRLLDIDLFARRPVIERIIQIREQLRKVADVQRFASRNEIPYKADYIARTNIENSGAVTLVEMRSRNEIDEKSTRIEIEIAALLTNADILLLPLTSLYGGAILLAYRDGNHLKISIMEFADQRELDAVSTSYENLKNKSMNSFDALLAESCMMDAIEEVSKSLAKSVTGVIASTFDLSEFRSQFKKLIFVADGGSSALPLTSCDFYHDGKMIVDVIETTFIPSIAVGNMLHSQRSLVYNKGGAIGAFRSYFDLQDMEFALAECEVVQKLCLCELISNDIGPSTAIENLIKCLNGARIWHFPGHGHFQIDDPLGSTIELSQDIRLSLEQLMDQVGLVAPKLVVLASCESGLFDKNNMRNELIGWPSAMMQLGAKGVIATLWKVNSFPTMLLMCKFYRMFIEDGIAASEALRKAQIWLRDSSLADLRRAVIDLAESESLTKDKADFLGEAFSQMNVEEDDTPFQEQIYWGAFVYHGLPGVRFKDE